MPRRNVIVLTVTCFMIFVMACSAFAQQRAQTPAAGQQEGQRGQRGAARVTRAPLFFREEWKQTPAGGEHPVDVPQALSNANLELKLIGPTGKEILMTGAVTDENNPVHLWTGMCTTPCGFTLREKTNFADLTGLARIKMVTKTSGFHKVSPVVKLADGTMLIGDKFEGSTVDWLESDVAVSEMRWRKLDPERIVTVGDWVNSPNLSKVDEIGFVDLMPGSGHGQGGWSDVARIEVYAKPVKRE
ncbi:MAG: hypothetical protein DMG14_27435 [Acidobacteria bacterium]|nr:MAG: hypothetical protein DMG14_27435 [Acidobacteriota bacterium]